MKRNWRKWSVMSHSRKTIRKLFDLVWAYLSLILSFQFIFVFLFLFFIFSSHLDSVDSVVWKFSHLIPYAMTVSRRKIPISMPFTQPFIYDRMNEQTNQFSFHPYPTTHYGNWAESQRKIIQHISQNGIFLFSIYFSFFAKWIFVCFSSFVFIFLFFFCYCWCVGFLLTGNIFFYLQHFILSLFAAARATFLYRLMVRLSWHFWIEIRTKPKTPKKLGGDCVFFHFHFPFTWRK